MKIAEIVNRKKAKQDKNGIWKTELRMSRDLSANHKTWEKIYNFNIAKLEKDRIDFKQNKLKDHISYIKKYFKFTNQTVYLEIGCGPSYIAEYLMNTYDCFFIGIDFNYKMLVTLKKYFDNKGFKKYILIHADINDMPLKTGTIDFIYGGGVIEHFKDPAKIINELHRVLKKGGIAFNTVPAFNLFWPMSMHKNIPSLPILKQIFEFFHIKLLNNKLLSKHHGYELSFWQSQLKKIHKKIGFKTSHTGGFAFHPSDKKLKNKFLRNLYFNFSKFSLTSPIIYIAAKK